MRRFHMTPLFVIVLGLIASGCATLPSGPIADDERPISQPPAASGPAARDNHFALTNVWETDTGAQIQLSELQGRPLVIAMFFASCEGACVININHLQEIDASLPPAVRERAAFVIVTFDPERDTSKALSEYRSTHHLATGRWTLLRGSARATADLATMLRTQFSRNSPRGILHTNEITVADAEGNIIERQSGTHPDLSRLTHALRAIAPKSNPAEDTQPGEAQANVPMKL